MPAITDEQIRRLADASTKINSVLDELDGAAQADVEPDPVVAEPQWVGEYRRTFRFLKELEARGGSVTPGELSSIARRNGYDPRGTGGFYRGKGALRRAGNRRELSAEGRRFIRRWEPEFGSEDGS